MNIFTKTKENKKAKEVLKLQRSSLLRTKQYDEEIMQHAICWMNTKEGNFVHKMIKVKDSYASNISPCVYLKNYKVSQLKCYRC